MGRTWYEQLDEPLTERKLNNALTDLAWRLDKGRMGVYRQWAQVRYRRVWEWIGSILRQTPRQIEKDMKRHKWQQKFRRTLKRVRVRGLREHKRAAYKVDDNESC